MNSTDNQSLQKETDSGNRNVTQWIKRMILFWLAVGLMIPIYVYYDEEKRKKENLEWAINNAVEGLSGQPTLIKFQRASLVSELRSFINTPPRYPRSDEEFRSAMLELWRPYWIDHFPDFTRHVERLKEANRLDLIPEGCTDILADPSFELGSIMREAGIKFKGDEER